MKNYLVLLRDILDNGEKHSDRTGVGTISVFGRQFRHDMREGFPLLTTKKLPFRWIAEELFWFLSGSTNEEQLSAKGVDIWKEWADKEHTAKFGKDIGDLGLVYGGLWRRFPIGKSSTDANAPLSGDYGYVDQIDQLIMEIQTNPNSRRLIVSGWHPYYQKRVSLPPCHTLWQCKVHTNTNEISLHLYARSIDSFLGLPFNIASYALLLSLIGKVTNLSPRELIISFGDVHIYKNHIEQVKLQLGREPYILPTLQIGDLEYGIKGLLTCNIGKLNLHEYNHHPKIQAEVAV